MKLEEGALTPIGFARKMLKLDIEFKQSYPGLPLHAYLDQARKESEWQDTPDANHSEIQLPPIPDAQMKEIAANEAAKHNTKPQKRVYVYERSNGEVFLDRQYVAQTCIGSILLDN